MSRIKVLWKGQIKWSVNSFTVHRKWVRSFLLHFLLLAFPCLSLPVKGESGSPLMYVQSSRHGVHHHTYYNTNTVTSTVHWGKEETFTGRMLQRQLFWELALEQSRVRSAEFITILICFNMPLICSPSNRFQAALDRDEESKWPKWEQVKTVFVIISFTHTLSGSFLKLKCICRVFQSVFLQPWLLFSGVYLIKKKRKIFNLFLLLDKHHIKTQS